MGWAWELAGKVKSNGSEGRVAGGDPEDVDSKCASDLWVGLDVW